MDATDAVELLKARDAYSSATALALLSVAVQLLAIAGGVGLPRVLPLGLLFANSAVSLAIAAYLIATRARPDRRLALAVGGLYAAFFLVLNTFVAARSVVIGRPFEAFVSPLLLVASFGLVVTGRRLGVVMLGAVFAQGIAIWFWMWTGHAPPALIPVTEPAALLIFAIIGASLLHFRYRRRNLALRYVRSNAELLAVHRVSDAFDSIARDLDSQLEIVMQGLPQLAVSSVAVARARRAVGRLFQLGHQLRDLTAPSPGGAPSAEEAERAFYAQDAQNGASTLALTGAMGSVALLTTTQEIFSRPILVLVATLGVCSLACFCMLFATRQGPTERRGIAAALFVMLPFALVPIMTQPELIRSGHAFEPLLAQKGLALILPLAVGRQLWLGLALEAALLAESAYLFFARGLASVADRISTFEPWLTLAYVLIGVGVLLASEHRRVASANAMRADCELSIQARRVGLQLAVLDQLGSPLQTLELSLAPFHALTGDREQTHAMTHALRALRSLRERIPALDVQTSALVRLSFDPAAALRRSP
jgi:hypothetical protein